MTEMAKLNLDENRMAKKGGQRKIIFVAIEVWVDVLGFVRRIQLARVCLANFKIYEICWPRLHGNRVMMAHNVWSITIGYRHEFGQPPTAVLLHRSKEVPFPECPPPDYITGFGHIQINYLDHQVLAFLSLIAPRITNKVRIYFVMKMSELDESEHASVNQRLQLCREKITTIHSIQFSEYLSSIQFLPDVDNKMGRIDCYVEEWDFPRDLLGCPSGTFPNGPCSICKNSVCANGRCCQKL